MRWANEGGFFSAAARSGRCSAVAVCLFVCLFVCLLLRLVVLVVVASLSPSSVPYPLDRYLLVASCVW